MSDLHGFDGYMVERGLSQNTITSYCDDVSALLALTGKRATEITANDIRSFIARRMRDVSASTARRQLVSFKTFFSYLADESVIESDPSSLVAPVKATQRIIVPPTEQEIETVLEGTRTTGTKRQMAFGLRDRAMIFTLYGSGLRVSEIIKLTTDDIDFQRQIITVRMGKGRKDRIAPMNQTEAEAIADWLKSGRGIVAPGYSGNLVFVGTHQEPITRQRVFQLLRWLTRQSVGRNLSPHKFRHAFCTDMVNGGCDIRVAQAMLGHSSLATTQRYLHTTIDELQQKYMQFHPRSVHA